MIRVNGQNKGKYSNAESGKYFPINREKYSGEYPPIFKSRLEHRFMRYCDMNRGIVCWQYESVHIKYFDKSSNPPKLRNYFIDFVIWVPDGKGGTRKIWVEVKHSSEVKRPVNESKTRNVLTWMKNQSKWEQAQKTARLNGAVFKVITEKQLV
jgi:hypothetical protein